MRLRTDDRAVTVQIGTVLLFAVLIVLLSTYQATVVPQQNERMEFNHNQQVQGQLQDLRDELLRAGATGSGGSASVALGTQYPVRAFFVNPAPPSGTLRTTDSANVTIENAVASGEVRDYWNGDPQNFSTRGLVYEPNYHEYQRPPTTVYRNGVLYNRFGGETNITLAGQRLVRDDRLSLISLDGNLSESSSSVASVDAQTISATTRTVTVRNETDENITIVVPTTLPKESATGMWRELLEDEGPVQTVTPGTDDSTVRIVLKPGTYQLRMAKVGVGSDATDVGPHYVTVVQGDDESVSAGGKQRVVAEVRDRFNNPVAGATVNVGGVSAGSVTPEEVETDEDGRATFIYHADETGSNDEEVSVTVEIDDGSEPRERADATLHIETAGGGDGGDQGDDGEDGAYQVEWESPADEPGTTGPCSAENCTYDAGGDRTLELTASTLPVADGSEIRFAVSNRSVATVAASGTTGGAGDATTTLTVNENGVVNVYAYSGGTGDAIEITVENVTLGDGGDGDDGSTGQTTAYPDEYNDIDYSGAGTDENNSIPPKARAVGEVTDFGDLGAADGATTGLDERDGDMQIGFATDNVSRAGINYALELEYNLPSYSGGVALQIVDQNGNVLQSQTLSYTTNNGYVTESITLNTAAESYVKNHGRVYVVYRKTDGEYVQIELDYQRIEVTTS